jgi:copper chaperone CopZ
MLSTLAVTLFVMGIAGCPGRNLPPRTITLKVDGMTCGACVNAITATLKGLPGVLSAHVELKAGHAIVTYKPGDIQVGDLVHAINRLGYRAHAPTSSGR